MVRITFVDTAGFLGMVESETGKGAARMIDALFLSGEINKIKSLDGPDEELAAYVAWHADTANDRIREGNKRDADAGIADGCKACRAYGGACIEHRSGQPYVGPDNGRI